jgi:triosephosphate isomerase
MRKQIAAANWKMNLTYEQAEDILKEVLTAKISLSNNNQVIFAVPHPYLVMAYGRIADDDEYAVAAQNCFSKKNGAFTGEVSAEMLQSIGIKHCIIGHSERREYFNESNEMLAEKVNICLQFDITPIFCCGEPLSIREKNEQQKFVEAQLNESLFHLNDEEVIKLIIAYEPIWAIGTGKTATTQEAQEMHRYIRSVIESKWGSKVAQQISILYGGSVKVNNAGELFNCEDVDGGLVGGASLVAGDFIEIIKALKK